MKANKNQIQDPAVQKTYTTEAAMHADQAIQKKGYLYVVTGAGQFYYKGTTNASGVDYEALGGFTPIAENKFGTHPAFTSQHELNGYLLANIGGSEPAPGGSTQNAITVNSPSTQSDYPIYLNVYNTAGTNAPNNVYLNGNVRSDWGDVRIKDNAGNYIPFAIVADNGDNIQLVFKAELGSGDTIFFIEYNTPYDASLVTKIGVMTDAHYDSAELYVGRDQALLRLDNFTARMGTYLPDLILEGGDKYGAVTTNSTTLLGFMQSVSDKGTEAATAASCPKYLWGWGNHDFEYTSFADVLAQYNGFTGQVAGNLYGTWEDADFRYISLDSNYKPADDTHQSNTHVGYGYINAAQKTWLTDTLTASTKPCIILCHHPLSEFDTQRINLTKETYHTQNRADIRDILEASNKVIFVLQGHTHTFMNNVINGISYVSICDLNEPPSYAYGWDFPNQNLNGRWSKIEIDRGSQQIRIIQEALVGTTVSTVYDIKMPFQNSLIPEYGNDLSETFSNGYSAPFEKSNIAIDASDFTLNEDAFIVVRPANLHLSEPALSATSLKIIGITASPNFGRCYWNFAPQSGKFVIEFSAQQTSLSEQRIKFERTANSAIGAYIKFMPDGTIVSASGATFSTRALYSINVWYRFKIILDIATNTYSISINGNTPDTGLNFFTASITSLDRLHVTTDPGAFYIDRLRIEKYVSPEPTITAIGATT